MILDPDIKKTLLVSRPLRYLDVNELDLLLTYCKKASFSAGETVLYQGKTSDGMYIILEGEAIVRARILGKGLMNLSLLKEGDFIGEMSLIEETPCSASVIAHTELRCIHITNTYFDMLSIFFPEMQYKITKAITETVCLYLRETYNKILFLMKRSEIVSHFSFGSLIKSLVGPKSTTFKEVNIDITHLKNTRFFKCFSEEEYDILLKHSQLIDVPAKCYLIKEKELDSSFYIILRGAVQSNIIEDSKVAKLSVLAPITSFTSIGFIEQGPALISYITCERSILLKIEADRLKHLQENNILLWYKLYDVICKSFVTLEKATDKLYIRLNSEEYK